MEYNHNIINEAATAEAQAKTAESVERGKNSRFELLDSTHHAVKPNDEGNGWVYVDSNIPHRDDISPKYVRIHGLNGWELGKQPIEIRGTINPGNVILSNIMLHTLHTGMPISTKYSEPLFNDVIRPISDKRARNAGAVNKNPIRMFIDENNIAYFYASDSSSLIKFKKLFDNYTKKHQANIELADMTDLVKSLQAAQSKISGFCKKSPEYTIEYTNQLADNIEACEKYTSFIVGLRSSTRADGGMNKLFTNNKIIERMGDDGQAKDAFPGMLKLLRNNRDELLNGYETQNITKENYGTYRDILSQLYDKNNPTDQIFEKAEITFDNKIRGIGMSAEKASDNLYDKFDAILRKFDATKYEDEDSVNSAAQVILIEESKYNISGRIGDTWHTSYVNTINAIAAHKIECLRKAGELEGTEQLASPGDVEQTSPDAATGTMNIPGYSYQFLYESKFKLKLDEKVTISLGTGTKQQSFHSILTRMSKAGHELLGYTPEPYIINIINSYATTRDMYVMIPAALLKASAVGINAVVSRTFGSDWFSPENKNRFQISKWLREEMQTKGGEVNPEVKKLEQHLANAPRSVRNAARQIRGKKPLQKPVVNIDSTNFDGTDLAPDRIKYADNQKNKDKVSGHYVKSTNDKDKGKLTVECADGGTAMAGATSAGDGFFQTPGSIGGEGNPGVPTYNQQPFVNGEKTSTKDSGSGDKFVGSINNKKSKKDNDWFDRVEYLPNISKFFEDWG